MEVEKKDLELFFKVLKATQLDLAGARMRDPFLKDLASKIETFYADRKVIYEKFCKKDEKGNPEIIGGNYSFDKEVGEEVVKELEILNNEVVSIPLAESLKGFIENSPYKPEFGEIEVIDKLLCKMN